MKGQVKLGTYQLVSILFNWKLETSTCIILPNEFWSDLVNSQISKAFAYMITENSHNSVYLSIFQSETH